MAGRTKKLSKESIYKTAAKLFANKGYENATMRELAEVLEINVSSLYNHFPGKRDILLGLYEDYAKKQERILPDFNSVLSKAERESPMDVLMSLNHYFPEDVNGMIGDILVTAASKMSNDPKSADLVLSSVKAAVALARRVIEYLIDSGKIEPLNVEQFCQQLLHVRISAVAQHALPSRLDAEKWARDFRYLHELAIKPTG